MELHFAARGGRVSKLKGKVVSFAPSVSASVVVTSTALSALCAPAFAQDASYAWGAQTSLSAYEDSSQIYQRQSAALDAVISNGAITSTTTGTATGPLATDLTASNVAATVTSNRSAASVDLFGLGGTGGSSNGVLANVLETVASDAYAAVTNTDIGTSSTSPSDGSLVGISDNRITASVTLGSSSNELAGALSTTFANSDVGASRLDPNGVTASGDLATATGTGGVLLQTSQIASDVQATIGTTANTAFAMIGDAGTPSSGSVISLTVAGTDSADQTRLEADGNRLTAAFTANTGANLVSVERGGMAQMNATAGLANLQIADKVGVDGTAVTDSASISALSGVTATANDLGTTSLALTDNRLTATSRLNAASNTVAIADGISLDGNATFNAVTTTVAAGESTIAAADLFANSVQLATDSRLSSTVDGTTGIDLLASGTVTNVSIDATDNAILADAEANQATTRIDVAGANTLDGVVAQSNVQSLTDATDNTAVAGVFASVANGAIEASVAATTTETVSGSSIQLSRNRIDASASANDADLATRLSGNVLSDGAVGAGAAEAPSISLGATSSTLQASYSSLNRQNVEGDGNAANNMVTADLTASEVALDVGNTSGSIGTSLVAADANRLATSVAANSATQVLDVTANVLDASVGLANQQALSGGLRATNASSEVTVDVERSGSASNLTISATGNAVSSGVTGNSASNMVNVDATTMSPDYLVALGSGAAGDLRSVLRLDGRESDSATATSGISLLNLQSTDTLASSSISSAISDADLSVLFGNGNDTVAGSLSGISVSADANRVDSMARANVASNTLDVAVGSFDMSRATGTGTGTDSTMGGTNLASLGSSQSNTSAVSSTIDATLGTAGSSDLFAAVDATTATVSGSDVSADENALTSLAAGNSATNTLLLTATTLSTPEAAQSPQIAVDVSDATKTTLAIGSAAIAVGNEQSNTGTITASIANGGNSGTTLVAARIMGADAISNTDVSADSNRVLAQAVAASGATTTATIDATSIASSAMVGSVQTNSGAVTARIGGSAGIDVWAQLDGAATGSSAEAIGNVLASTATALTDSTSLLLGGENTASLDGAAGATASSVTAASGVMTVAADYAVVESQTNTGAIATSTRNSLVKAEADALTNGTAQVGQNLIAAQATAVSATTELSGTATSMATDAPVVAVATDQTNTGALTSDMTSNSLSVQTGAATSSSLALIENAVRSAATALSAGNTATLDATAAMVGAETLLSNVQTNGTGAISASLGLTNLDITASSATTSSVDMANNSVLANASGIVASNEAALSASLVSGSDATLRSTQANTSNLTASLYDIGLAVSTGATSGSVALEGNTIRAGVTGVSASNATRIAGTSIADSSASLLSEQTNGSALTASVGQADMTVTAAAVTGDVSLSNNRTVAAATATLGTNRVSVAGSSVEGLTVGGTAMTAAGAYANSGTPVATLRSVQTSSGAISSTVDDYADAGAPKFLASLSGGVNGAVSVDGNLMVSQSRGNVADNALQLSATSSIDATTQGVLASSQTRSSGAISAAVNGTGTTGQIGVLGSGSMALNSGRVSVDNNVVRASGSANTAVNAMDVTGATIAGAALKADPTLAGSPKVTAGTQFAVLNAQTNGSNVSASVADMDFIAKTGTGAISGTVSLNGNMAMADATGNSAVNALRLAAAGSSAAPVAAVNYQSNSANMSATVDSVQFVASGGASNGSVTLGGNSILATSTGNNASSSVSAAGTSAFTSF